MILNMYVHILKMLSLVGDGLKASACGLKIKRPEQLYILDTALHKNVYLF